MIPIEVVAIGAILVFGLVGLVRGFPRELGATLAFVAMLLGLELAGGWFGGAVFRALFADRPHAPTPEVVEWAISMAFIAAWVIVVYAGRTFTFSGTWPPNPLLGITFDGLIGALNGWLVVWTAWGESDRLGYPQAALGLVSPDLTPRGEALVGLAPLALIPDGGELWVLGGCTCVLVFLLVVR